MPRPSREANINIKTSTVAEEGESKMILVDIDVDAYRRKYCQSMLYKEQQTLYFQGFYLAINAC